MNKAQERLLRQQQIAALAMEMQTTVPSVKSFAKDASEDDAELADGATLEIGNDDDSEDDVVHAQDDDMNQGGNRYTDDRKRYEQGKTSATSQQGASSDKVSSSLDKYAEDNKIPISHQVDLRGHEKAIMSFSIEPSGNRVVTGSLDYQAKMYDFGGMDQRHRAFRSFEPVSGHPVVGISHSPSGDRCVIGTGSAQPKVYDREGNEVITFAKGDMYIRDLVHTKGHTMEVTGVSWHPSDKNLIISSSLDGSVRIWDLLGEAHFGNLISKHVLKLRGATGQGRLGATCCCYSPNGMKVFAGAADGSIQIWNEKKIYSRADYTVRPAHLSTAQVCSIVVSPDNAHFASRGSDDVVYVWDTLRPQKPKLKLGNLPNNYPTANVDFSPDGAFLCCGTTPAKVQGDTEPEKSILAFFDIKRALKSALKASAAAKSSSSSSSSMRMHVGDNAREEVTAAASSNRHGTGQKPAIGAFGSSSSSKKLDFTSFASGRKPGSMSGSAGNAGIESRSASQSTHAQSPSAAPAGPPEIRPCMQIGVAANTSVITVKWQAKTNQIFCRYVGTSECLH